jgi:O-antigen/teichoic acid export membrane protein
MIKNSAIRLRKILDGQRILTKEQQSSEQHGINRSQRIALTGFATIGSKGVNLLAGFISIPLTAGYLGAERFGLWLTLSTFLSWVSLADLGLANSLTNVVATADAHENPRHAQTAIASAFWLMTLIGLMLATVFIIFYPLIDWRQVFNVSSISIANEAGGAALIGLILFVLRLPFSIPSRIYTAYQEGYLYQLWVGFGSCLSLAALSICIYLKASLPVLVGTVFGSSLLGDVCAAIYLFYWHRPMTKPTLGYFQWNQSIELLKIGIQFWIVQISAIVFLQTDLIMVAQLFGAKAVATYGVTLKLFTIIGLVQAAFLAPLWSAYNEALARRDIGWIIKTFKKSLITSVIWSIAAGVLLSWLSPWLITRWIGTAATPQIDLMIAMFFLSVFTAFGQCIGCLLNGLGKVADQAIYGVLAALTNLALSILLGKLFGLAGVTWATTIAIVIFSIILIGSKALTEISRLHRDLINN